MGKQHPEFMDEIVGTREDRGNPAKVPAVAKKMVFNEEDESLNRRVQGELHALLAHAECVMVFAAPPPPKVGRQSLSIVLLEPIGHIGKILI